MLNTNGIICTMKSDSILFARKNSSKDYLVRPRMHCQMSATERVLGTVR